MAEIWWDCARFTEKKLLPLIFIPKTVLSTVLAAERNGDVITFIMKIENLDYVEAVKFLAQRAGMEMPENTYDDSMSKLRMRIYEANREAARFFHSTLISPRGQSGLNYLRGRALSDRTIRHFGLGFADDDWNSLCNF